ncbi:MULTISPECIES: ABC transporter permease [Rhodobacterales]|jgi:ABC-2 type transport system permease protein|uniref:ABC transporter permease n=1 Tax=Thioclava atlantica TaxID=1317124 RepID=A0A085TU48_9RHOB|nr:MULTISPECIES: ABC transporter permease [Rhodobacterales]KFE34245.1 ABC transporter permease [Thioclava atlantica]
MIRAFRAEMAGIFRDRQVLMIVVLALAIYGLIYPAPYRPELLRVVPVVAVDLDGGESAREVLRRIDASESVTLAARLTDMAAADRAVQSRDAYGIVLIPQGFERDLLSGRPSPIAVYGDASYFLVYQKVLSGMAIPVRQMGATIAAGRLMAGQQLDAETATALASPAQLVEVPLFNPSGGYATYVLPAAFVLILHQTMAMGLALVAVRRRPSPAPVARQLAGRGLAWLVIYAALLPLFLVALPRAYGLPWLGDLRLVAALGLPFVLATGLMAQLIAALLKRTEVIQPVLLAMGLPLFFLSGFSWPIEAIPPALQAIAAAIPATPMIDAYTQLASMGATGPELATAIRHLWILAALFGLGAALAARSARPSQG